MPIRKVKNGWKIDNTDVIHKTRESAVKMLKAIKASQAEKRKKRKQKTKRYKK